MYRGRRRGNSARRAVCVCVVSRSGGRGSKKHKIPLKRTTYSNTFGALFSKSRNSCSNGPGKCIWTSYIHSIFMFFGREKVKKYHAKGVLLFERISRKSTCDKEMMKMGPQSAPEPYHNEGIFTRLPEGLENGSSKPYVFVVFWDAFWPIFRFWGQKSASGSKTLNPVRTPGCGFRCFSWKIASRNHQYSLG